MRAAYACRAGWGTGFEEAVLDLYLKKVWRLVFGWGPRRVLPSPLVRPGSALQAADRFAAAVALLPTGWEAAAREAGWLVVGVPLSCRSRPETCNGRWLGPWSRWPGVWGGCKKAFSW